MRRFLIVSLSLLAIALILPIALASAASKNVDIIVTHDLGPPGSPAFIATQTIQEIAHTNQAANWPLQRGMAFKNGDVMPGNHVEIRQATAGNDCTGPLLDYQWDDIATRIENGGNGSWRTATYTVRLPAIGANQHYSMAFCRVSGSYTPSGSGLTLSDLCAIHDFTLDFNNVENQTVPCATAVLRRCGPVTTSRLPGEKLQY